MKNRYQVWFEEGVCCRILEDYPDLIPIVDISLFGLGQLLCFATSKYEAEFLVDKLNSIETLKKSQ